MVFVPRIIAVALFLCLCFTAAAKSTPHIVLISIDTLRADHLTPYGYAKPTAPYLAARAKEGLLFEQVIVPVPATTPSHASMLTGVHPFVHGAVANAMPIAPGLDTLAAAMKRRGYATAGAVSVFHVGGRYGFNSGFDFFSEPVAGEIPAGGEARPGTLTNKAALALVDRVRPGADKPLFLFVHYFDLHWPYGWWDRSVPEPRTHADRLARYDDGIRHVDRLIQQLMSALKTRGLDRVTVFVTSDHGEQIGERGLEFGHADIYKETTDVPLIAWGEGVRRGRVRETVSMLEVGPAIAAFAGAEIRNAVPETNTVTEALDHNVFTRLAELVKEPKRSPPVLVVGYPGYTRSLLLADQRYRLVKNFDYVYRDVATGPAPVKPEGRETKPTGVGGDVVEFRLGIAAFDPYIVTFDHYTPPDCPATLSVTVDGAAHYFKAALKPGEGTRAQFAGARRDQLSVWVRPAKCAGRVFTSVTRMQSRDALKTAAPTVTAAPLFTYMMAARKRVATDELYDLRTDPGMRRNLIASPALRGIATSMQRQLRTIFESVAEARTPVSHKQTPEEVKRLRSLGYIQ
jgi:hypothetical protein